MVKFYILPLLFLFLFSSLKAQLFIDDGTSGTISIRNASGGTLGSYDNANTTVALFVDGDITVEGTFDNQAAETQLTGNITKSAIGVFTTTGDEVFVSAPNATITTDINQRIDGAFTGSSDFFNLILHKPATKYVDLATTIEVENTIKFNNSGRIRTDVAGHTNDGSAYPFEIYLKNGATNSLVNYSTGNGATEKYIEGRLRRKATTTGVFYYPIGVAPTSLDGMEAFELNFGSNPNMDFVGYIKPATVAPIIRNILCNVGKTSGHFDDCTGPPDPYLDWYKLETSMDLSHEWVATPGGSTTGYDYGITLHPGSSLDGNNAINYYAIPPGCGAPYQNLRLRVVAKNGVIGGNQQIGPGQWNPWKDLGDCYQWCQFDNADLDISLNLQTSFSSFRIHGTKQNIETGLPIELLYLKAEPINNNYINVSWATASELNNNEFEVLRSINGFDFSYLSTIKGNGTTNQLHTYQFDDKNVQPNIIYYYKLKEIDFDGSYKFSNIVNAKLNASDAVSISDIYPNPTTNEAYINIIVPKADALSYSFYNAIGQEIITNTIQLQNGFNKILLEHTDLATGTYLVKFNFSDNISTKKLIKQ